MVTHVDFKAGDIEHGVISVPSPLPGKYFVMAENGVGGKALEFFLRNVVYADDAFATGAMPADAFERAAEAGGLGATRKRSGAVSARGWSVRWRPAVTATCAADSST